MSVFDYFRKFFGGSNQSIPNQSDPEFHNDFRNPIWGDTNDDDSDGDFRNPDHFFSFNIYTDPLEIHRYFEQQVDEMLKNFRVLESFQDIDSFFGSGSSQFPEGGQSPFEFFQQPPAIEAPKESLRDQILKPEFKRIESPSDKVDQVLDGQVDASDIGKALDGKDASVPIWSPNNTERSLLPRRDHFFPNTDSFSFSGRSVVSRIVRRPDGTMEREEIVKESDGTERKTVTRSVGGHEYSVTTVTDPLGVESRTENYKNINPDKLDDFNKAWDGQSSKWKTWWNDRNPFF